MVWGVKSGEASLVSSLIRSDDQSPMRKFSPAIQGVREGYFRGGGRIAYFELIVIWISSIS